MFDLFLKKTFSIKNIIFIVALIAMLLFLATIKDIAILFFASFVVACSLNPLVDKLEQKKMNRRLASGVLITLIIIVSSLFFIPLLEMAVTQVKNLLLYFPDFIENLKNFLSVTPILNKSAFIKMDLGAIFNSVSGFTSNFVNESINLSKDFAAALVYLFAACIIVYYFLADKKELKTTYTKFFPAQMKPRANEILDSISKKVGGYVTAQLVTIFSVGLIMTVGLLILRVDYAIILGLLNAVLDLVPIVGPFIALIITMLVALKLGPLTLVLIILLFIIAQWAENNLVRPYIFGKFLDLHPLIIYFSLFVTAQFLGVIGVIFAPAIAATVCVLIEELYIKSINE